MLMADFSAYVNAQSQADALFKDPQAWSERAILNVAGMGAFSTDRTISEYIDRVWSYKAA
jgi:starch phosphorylase